MFEVDAVVTVCRRKYLYDSLASISNQLNCKVNLYIVKDGNCESVDDILSKFDCKVFSFLQNVGPYKLINLLAPHLKSQYFCIQDSDDISLPNRLHCSLTECYDKQLNLFGASIEEFGDNYINRTIKPLKLQDDCIAPVGKIFLVFPHPTLVVERDYFIKINGYRDVYCGGDVEFMNRCYWAGARMGTTNDVLVQHRIHDDQLTKSVRAGYKSFLRENIIKELKDTIKIYPDHRGDMEFFRTKGDLDKTNKDFKLSS
jgi:glycosyltransferase involved in cell wall biosynthesis